MPKLKTHRGAAKRFKKTGTGKFKRGHAFGAHILTSKSRKRKRRSHLALKPIHYVRCPQCGSAKLPHAACDNCGYVNPKLALQVESDNA